MPLTLLPSPSGVELSNLEWLLDHHSTKESERRQMVTDLNLQAGERVLDLGCGPGLWASMFAEKVGPSGEVIGMDFAPELIEHAASQLEDNPFGDVMRFMLASFYEIPLRDQTVDAIFLGNCCSYVSDVVGLLNEMKRVTKVGGRVISKEFDDGATIFNPVDPYLNAKVVEGVSRTEGETAEPEDIADDEPPSPKFNSFMGRRMHGFFREAGFEDISTKTYAIHKVPPLAPEAKRYVQGLAKWLGVTAEPYLSEDESRSWHAAFDPKSDEYVLDREDFYVCMIEMITAGTVA
jgi:ubiquinone/menaquinone biosynthesis C-methylase UbiE